MTGTHFPGFGFYQFEPHLMPDSATTVIKFWFRTRFAGGLVFFAASRLQKDMVAVELRDGLPWFIFDTESGAVAFTVAFTEGNHPFFHKTYFSRKILGWNM